MPLEYVHGYSPREAIRLADQANTLADLLHHDTHYPAGSRVLEAGCGAGSQTIHLAPGSPNAAILSIDRSEDSLATARERIEAAGHKNVEFQQADIFDLPFESHSFDHVFVCFVLEHLQEPAKALRELKKVVRPGGTITAIEGDHGSWYCHPQTPEAAKTVQCLIDAQALAGGNSLIGRQLYPLLASIGLLDVQVSPRMVYVDSSRPQLVEGFSRNTFIAMVEGVRDQALEMGMVDKATWDKGIGDMYRATEADGTFCYTFFKAIALRP
jgi:SAM-dependent methyltransferase